MLTLNTTGEGAEDVLVHLAAHLPPHVPIGRPQIVAGRGVIDPDAAIVTIDDGATMWHLDAGGATRTAVLLDGAVETTRWLDGREIARSLLRME